MKQANLIIQGVLALAIVGLYVLYFTNGSNMDKVEEKTGAKVAMAAPTGNTVYINIDSVLNGYDMYFDIQEELQNKLKTSEAKFNSRQDMYKKALEDYQYKVQRGLVTRSERAEIEQNLMQEEQELLQLQNSLQRQLAEEEQVAQRKVIFSIMDYLENDKDINQYQFVLGTTFGGNILYANQNLNITQQVINGLNSSYGDKKTE